MPLLPFLMLTLLPACKDGEPADTAEPYAPDLYCPGDPSGACADNSGVLSAGAAMVDITPTCFESWVDQDGNAEYSKSSEEFLDCGCDRLCPGDDGYTAPDEGEGDGVFQAVWMAGFQNSRPAMDVHDPLWARTVVLDQGGTRVAIVAVDLIGFFHDDVLATRDLVTTAGLDVDYVVVSSTHQHEGPDTMGIWGPRAGETGVDLDYIADVRAGIAESVAAAVAELREVGSVRVGHVDATTYSDIGTRNLIRDSRDPLIIDERVRGARITDTSGATIATLANWGNHPEALSDENNSITSDYSDSLRRTIEEGKTWSDGTTREGHGGVSIYLQGTVGGLMTPLGITCTDGDGVAHGSSDFAKAECIGTAVGEMVLDAVEGGEDLVAPSLSFRMETLYFPVHNAAFQAMVLIDVFERTTYFWDPEENITEDNIPWMRTEVAQVSLGGLELLTIPGELFPELAFGGYDGSKVGSPLDEFIDPDNPNPPDVSLAPDGPYLADRLGSDHAWILGLGNDELGYIVPAYDFKVGSVPYLVEAEGDHYEETNSIGPETAPRLDEAVIELLEWSP